MNTIRVLAIDDEPLALQQLAAYIKKVPFLELVAQCESALQARDILNEELIDAIFCDINMPDLNGMDFVKSLTVPPLIVFTTAYAEYAVEGFRVNAVDYLLKPFGMQDFLRAANRVKEKMENQQTLQNFQTLRTLQTLPPPLPVREGSNYIDDENAAASHSTLNGEKAAARHTTPLPHREGPGEGLGLLFVKSDYRMLKISISDIRYVEGMSEYLKLHLDSQPKPIVTLLSMKGLEERLPKNFMRIHRSYIVNLDKIVEVNKNRIILDADTYLPIGDSYRDRFNQFIEAKFLGK